MNPLQEHILLGVRTLAGNCDGARQRDDVGFDSADQATGHRIGQQLYINAEDSRWCLRACLKYRRQLGDEFNSRLTVLYLEHGLSLGPVAVPTDNPSTTAPDPLLTTPLDSILPLTEEQESALSTIQAWLETGERPEFKLGGYAGTGKTTVIKALKGDLKTHAVVCAFTGKAVNVLQRKGVNAMTMHSLMYDVLEDEDGNVSFHKKSFLRDDPNLVIVDEASMMSTELYNDLKSYKVPLLLVGDPGQLEPVGDNPNLMAKPDLILSKIHRQAEKSPIIRFASDIRLGKIRNPQHCNTPELIIKGKIVRASEYIDCSQAICAKNKTRTSLNTKIRLHKGYKDQLVVGDKLICLRNNRMRGVFNGMILFVEQILDEGATYWGCKLRDEIGKVFAYERVWKEPFQIPLVQDVRVPFNHIYCDYGYVITCHKSQGSEWDHVLVLDEWMPPQVWDMKRWRYTAITRAAKKLTFCV